MIRVEERVRKYEYHVETIPIERETAEKALNRLAESGWRLVHATPTAVRESTIAPEPRLIPSLYCVFERYSSNKNAYAVSSVTPESLSGDEVKAPPSRPLAVFN